ncbi:VOC family protein [Cyanobium sp. HWJ4-Hawea]|nr:VOC family protein [Cyanobium sp. HWJ4-Hawea]
MTVADTNSMVNFFEEIFDFESQGCTNIPNLSCSQFWGYPNSSVHVNTLKLGRELLEIRSSSDINSFRLPVDTNGNDLWFRHFAIVTSNIDDAFNRIRDHVIFTSTSPQTLPSWNVKASGIKAFKFKTPEHHSIELIQFPPGKGKPEWQSKDKLFLGIDHTAISVGNVESSRLFYEKIIGMNFLGSGTNYGVEQSSLDGLVNSKVEILSFGVDDGIGLEFLHYVEPADGRKNNNITGVNWYFRVVVCNLNEVAQKAFDNGVQWVSNGIQEIDAISDFRRGLVLRDPDGHIVEVMESL